jgi:hypothetical protein
VKPVKERTGTAQDSVMHLMLGYLCIATEPAASLVRKVKILDRFDFSDAGIAKVCGVSVQSVRNARLIGKKKRPRKGNR